MKILMIIKQLFIFIFIINEQLILLNE